MTEHVTAPPDVFNIIVNAVNDPPNTVTDTLFVDEGGTVTTTTALNSSLLDNDTDGDGPNPISMQLVSTPQHDLNFAWSTTGTFTYEHDGTETTTDSFTYRSYDGQDQGNIVIVNITINPVNDCPQNTASFRTNTINEDGAGFGFPIGSLDVTDPDNAYPLTSYTVTYTNASLATVTFDPAVGDPYFAPKLHQNGTMTGTVTISDGSCFLDVPFEVIILPVNDCPVVDNMIADVSANEDDPDRWIDIQTTFSDIESTTLNYSVSSNDPSIVVPSLTSTAIILDFQDDANGNATIIITATDGDINCTTDDLFDVTIASINDNPTTNPDAISVVSGNTVSVLNDGVTTSVLANDSDPEGQTLSAQLVTPPVNGTLVLNPNGNFTYQHNGSATTTDVFYYLANDGFLSGNTTSVTIYINNPPVAVTDTIFVMEAGTATTTSDGSTSLLANDTDADPGDVALLTATLTTNPQYGNITLNSNGTFTYVHNGASFSSDSFAYAANDGKVTGAPVTVSIVVTGTNDPPTASNDNIIVPLNGTATTLDNGATSLLANDSDPDGDVLTVSLVSSPSFGTLTLNPGGTFTYVQNGTLNSGDSFTYKVSDGTLDSGNTTVNIYLTCTPTKQSIVEGGPNGVSFSFSDEMCKTVRVYVPKRKAYSFCHLDGSIVLNARVTPSFLQRIAINSSIASWRRKITTFTYLIG